MAPGARSPLGCPYPDMEHSNSHRNRQNKGYITDRLLFRYTSHPVSGVAGFGTIGAGMTANHHRVGTEWKVLNLTDATPVVDPARQGAQ